MTLGDIRIDLPETARAEYDALVVQATSERWAERLFDRDTSLWTDDPDVSADIADRLGWLDAPAAVHASDPRPRGLRRRRPRGRLRHRRRDGHGRLEPRSGRPRPNLRHGRGLPRPPDPRLDGPGGGRRGHGRPRSARDPVDRREQVGDDHRAARVPRRGLVAGRGGAGGAEGGPEARRVLRGHHRPGQEPRGDPPSRRPARGVPEPAGRRRALLGAHLRGPRARVADRARPRRAARLRLDDARRVPRAGRGRESGAPARAGNGWPRQGGPRQAHVPRRSGNRQLRGVGRAADRRVDGQAGRGHRARRPGACPPGNGVRRGSRVRRIDPRRQRRGRRPRGRGLARACRAAGHPDRARRPDRHRRRDGSLGGRDGHRGRRPRHRPVRPAERRGGQGADAPRPRRRGG